jgi:hypothetical protein
VGGIVINSIKVMNNSSNHKWKNMKQMKHMKKHHIHFEGFLTIAEAHSGPAPSTRNQTANTMVEL